MLPAAYQLPAAIVLLVGGLVSCFFGYRLFRIVLAIYGFIFGAFLGSSMMGAGSPMSLLIAALVGGLVGSIVLVAAYFVGVALVGAGLGALVVNVLWAPFGGDPHPLVVLAFAILGAVGAMIFQRYVIIVATSFGGAWTMLVGALTMTGNRVARAAAGEGDVWLLYPFSPGQDRGWVLIVWLILGVAGMVVQLQHKHQKG